jgi:hypothetical protein
MATTTPNFGWPVPTSSDLVKNGATAIEGLGDAIDASLLDLKGGTTNQVLAKNSNTDMDFKWVSDATGMTNPMTTTGDVIYSSSGSTPDRLGLGTAGQVLQVNSGATAPEWATPAGGASGMTFISRTSFSNVASQAIDSVFSSSYFSYLVRIESIYAATEADNLMLQFRYGATTQAAGYYGSALTTTRSNTTTTNTPSNNTSELTFSLESGSSANPSGAIEMIFNQVGNASEQASVAGYGLIGATAYGLTSFACKNANAETYTGFLLKSGSSNITGVVSVYGLAKA